MKIGITVEGQEDLSWDRWRRITALVEELGFDSLWRSDHLLSRMDEARGALETWTSLAVAAAETSRIVLGPLVCPMTFRHPAMLARLAESVDTLSGGRLVLGLGSGWNAREHRAFGLPFPEADERIERLAEGIEVVRRLWGPGTASFVGRYYHLDEIDALPKPVRGRIPILIGGTSSRLVPTVTQYADEWNMTTNAPRVVRRGASRLADRCRAIGRDPRSIVLSVAAGVIIGGGEAELGRRCESIRRWVPDLACYASAEVISAAHGLGWLCGTPDDVVAALRALAEEGVERVMLQHNDWDDEDVLRILAREVLPAVESVSVDGTRR